MSSSDPLFRFEPEAEEEYQRLLAGITARHGVGAPILVPAVVFDAHDLQELRAFGAFAPAPADPDMFRAAYLSARQLAALFEGGGFSYARKLGTIACTIGSIFVAWLVRFGQPRLCDLCRKITVDPRRVDAEGGGIALALYDFDKATGPAPEDWAVACPGCMKSEGSGGLLEVMQERLLGGDPGARIVNGLGEEPHGNRAERRRTKAVARELLSEAKARAEARTVTPIVLQFGHYGDKDHGDLLLAALAKRKLCGACDGRITRLNTLARAVVVAGEADFHAGPLPTPRAGAFGLGALICDACAQEGGDRVLAKVEGFMLRHGAAR